MALSYPVVVWSEEFEMMLRRLLFSTFAVALAFSFCGVVQAQGKNLDWAEKMFSNLKIDFGTVARGADTRTVIIIENLYQEDVTLVKVGTTCGCTAAKPDKTLLKTHEKARIQVVMNTVKFTHRKDSNVDVTLRFHGAKGAATKTIRVPITAYIRTDVVITPGNADFGSVEFGQSAEKTLKIAYAGRQDWRITGIRNGNDLIDAQVVETERANGRVTYQLSVQLKGDARIGAIQGKIYLLTNDQSSAEVPVLITGRVSPDIEILPSKFALGKLKPGEVKQFNIVIKGKRPFSITEIECDTHPDCFEIRELKGAMKTVHIVPFKLTTPDLPGEFAETFTVTIAGRPTTLSFNANGIIRTGS